MFPRHPAVYLSDYQLDSQEEERDVNDGDVAARKLANIERKVSLNPRQKQDKAHHRSNYRAPNEQISEIHSEMEWSVKPMVPQRKPLKRACMLSHSVQLPLILDIQRDAPDAIAKRSG
jgi:hypothetical protein